MKLSINLWQLIGFGVTCIFGVLLHFLYEWTNLMIFIPFSCVNESTWEHMKIAFIPMFIFAIIQSFYYKERDDFWYIKLKGILVGIFLIPIIFYTYNGVIGKSPDWINIAIFIICIFIAFLYERNQLNMNCEYSLSSKYSIIILCMIAVLFFIFSFKAPNLGIFIDPLK